ncbi:hypothetical protein [Andreprevotia sp. IGB-42]|uniref:hypothetical protein n=1 Tax=Andreprevotia sp. IGB-42 TaxID=2497473 RepID=UPI0013588C68|nr:hypothetical protein [Andreprevotia sp. IGB-42]
MSFIVCCPFFITRAFALTRTSIALIVRRNNEDTVKSLGKMAMHTAIKLPPPAGNTQQHHRYGHFSSARTASRQLSVTSLQHNARQMMQCGGHMQSGKVKTLPQGNT